jgi:hypothetical protein
VRFSSCNLARIAHTCPGRKGGFGALAATGPLGCAESIVDYLIAHGARLQFCDRDYPNIVEFARSRDEQIAKHVDRVLKGRGRLPKKCRLRTSLTSCVT